MHSKVALTFFESWLPRACWELRYSDPSLVVIQASDGTICFD